jgi:voltage-gated potassium channel
MVETIVLNIAKRLDKTPRYLHIKEYFKSLLSNSQNPKKRYIDLMMIFFIVTSIVILIYEVQNPLPHWIYIYDIYFVSLIFLIEYLLRFWVYSDMHKSIIDEYENSQFLGRRFDISIALKEISKKKWEYLTKPSSIIDLLAILPAYRPFRILRFFVLFRIFKLLRYTKSINQFVDVLANKRFELLTLLFILLFVVVVSGVAIYVFEEELNPNIDSLFDALYWALVTISTVGYGDISPVTTYGRIISIVIIISGIAMISFATSVIVSAFSEKLGELKESRAIDKIKTDRVFIVICGYGKLTKLFLHLNARDLDNYIIIEKESHKVRNAIDSGYHAICDDATRQEALKRYNIDYAKMTLLCLTNSDVENIYITLNAKTISPKIRVIARASDSKLVKKYNLAGASEILLPNEIANTMLFLSIKNPIIYRASHTILMSKSVAIIDEVIISKGGKLVGKSIEMIDFKATKLLFIGIQRGEESQFLFNPAPQIRLLEGDILLVMGMQISLEYFKELYQ